MNDESTVNTTEPSYREKLRDQFAMAVLPDILKVFMADPGQVTPGNDVAKQCYIMADFMINERKAGKNPHSDENR